MYYIPNWMLLFHIIGIVLWVGGLLAVTQTLSKTEKMTSTEVSKLVEIASRMERMMTLPGFTLAFIAGFLLLFANAFAHSPLKQGWMHIKLTVVFLGFVPIQGIIGVRRKKLRQGADPDASARTFRRLFFALILLTFLVTFLIIMKPTNNPLANQASWF